MDLRALLLVVLRDWLGFCPSRLVVGYDLFVCRTCPTTAAADRHRELSRVHTAALRVANKSKVIKAYGGKCFCCGESEPSFLCIDHINDDGASHRELIGYGRTTDGRRKVGSGSIMYAWLVKNGFPEDFQLLCANCNMAKQSLGYCPHKRM
jgi:hypothetical protein